MHFNHQRVCALILSSVYIVGAFLHGSIQGQQCRTPNNETALCIPVKQCTIMIKAIATRNQTAIDFARQSQCGYEHGRGALVCCGSTAYPITSESRFVIKIKLKPFIHNNLPHSTICGLERSDHRIYGGQATELDEFPWASLLWYKNEDDQDVGFRCGGTLINHKYVITAAHCVTLLSGLYPSRVRLGEWRLSTVKDCVGENQFRECSDLPIDVDIDSTLPHPQYNKRLHVNDIALVRLKQDVRYTDFVRPICLPPPNYPPPDPGTKVFSVGWGATERGDSSDVKLKVRLAVVSQQECASKMRQRTQISDRHLCAGGTKGKDTCQGDSGGSLMMMEQNEATYQLQWFLEGIISWGVGCGIDGYPGIYTHVSKFSSWIVYNMVFR